MLTFTDTEGRSYVSGREKQINGNTYNFTGNTGIIYSNADNKAVMHESGHFIGLADRYDDWDGMNLGGSGSTPDKGFEKDLMGSSRNSGLIDFHYQQYIDLARGYAPNIKKIIRYVQIGVDNRGRVITPFEEGGLHINHPYVSGKIRGVKF